MGLHVTLKGILGHAISGAGRTVDYLTPGQGSGFATDVGRSMYGRYNDTNNPLYAGANTVSNARFNNGTQQTNKPTGNDPGNGYDPYGNYSSGSNGSYAAGGSGGTSAVDPASGLRQQAQDKIRSILGAYDSLFGGIDNTVQDRANQINSNYDTQANQLNKSYEAGQGQTGAAYSARGLGQSSFLGDALGQNTDIYNQNNQQMVNDRQNSLADLGRYAATNKSQLNVGKQQYNDMLGGLDGYDANSLASLIPSLQSAYGDVQNQAAGLGSNQQFLGGLNAITPTQNHGVDQLGTKLQQLVQSGTPQFAKQQLANGLIKQAQLSDPNQQSYWQNYFNSLLNTGA